jgi:hypothetical protein
MSANKLSTKTLEEYFNDKKLNYHSLLETLSLQLICQLLVFYHTLLKMKPSFSHRDFKLDNILVRELPSHNLSQNITILGEDWRMEINSPFIFLINDFEKSEIDSAQNWFEDFKFLFFSIGHYRNLLLPKKLLDLFSKNANTMTYNELGELIKDDMFRMFMKRL